MGLGFQIVVYYQCEETKLDLKHQETPLEEKMFYFRDVLSLPPRSEDIRKMFSKHSFFSVEFPVRILIML
jgi:hypothetical protein